MANGIDIKEIVGKEAIKGLEKTNLELKKSNDLLKENIKLLDTLNKEYGEVKNTVQLKEKLNKQEKINNGIQKKQKTIIKQNTDLEKERIRVQKQLASTQAKTAAVGEKNTRKLRDAKIKLREAEKAERLEAEKRLGVAKKSGGLFKSLTGSILAAGAAMISIGAAAKILKKAFTTVFLGTQDNIDFFNVKLEGMKARFAVLTDAASNFGDTLIKSLSIDDKDSFFNRLGEAAKVLNLSRLVFKQLHEDMDQNEEDAETLQKAMNELNEIEIEYTTTKAKLRQEMFKARLDAKKAGDDSVKGLEFVDKAIVAEKELMSLEVSFLKERARIAKERLDLSISTRADKLASAKLDAAVIDIETKSIKKLATLEAERLTFLRKIGRENNQVSSDRIADIERLEVKEAEAIDSRLEDINSLTITYKDVYDKLEDWEKDYTEFVKSEEEKRAALRKELASKYVNQFIELGDTLFDLGQSQKERELESLRADYDSQIQLAEGDKDRQEALSKELAIKQWEIELELAKSEQNQAIISATINAAAATIKAWADGGIGLALLAAAAGIAEISIIKNQPLPTAPVFHDGTLSSPDTFIAGDGTGKSRELMLTKDGKMMLTPNHATLYEGMAGTQIIPNKQTEQILSAVNLANAGAIDTKQLESKIDDIGEIFKRTQSKLMVTNINSSSNNMPSKRIVTRYN